MKALLVSNMGILRRGVYMDDEMRRNMLIDGEMSLQVRPLEDMLCSYRHLDPRTLMNPTESTLYRSTGLSINVLSAPSEVLRTVTSSRWCSKPVMWVGCRLNFLPMCRKPRGWSRPYDGITIR